MTKNDEEREILKAEIIKLLRNASISDLRAVYDQYGLDGEDLLVVGGVDDDVMKIGADGQLVPVE